jgi:uncharacterized coiled-coil DUF342 family protein
MEGGTMPENLEEIQKTKRQIEEDHTPLWIKWFGGTIISITFLTIITITSYIVNNLNNLQNQVNASNIACVSHSMWETMTAESKKMATELAACKERLNAIEKIEARIAESEKNIEKLSKEIVAQKEKFVSVDQQILQIREEFRQVVKDLQTLREKVAILVGKENK